MLKKLLSSRAAGATENARPDIERPSKLWGLTSRDWTTRHHITDTESIKATVSMKDIASAQREAEVPQLAEFHQITIFTLPSAVQSTICWGGFITKPDKAQLILLRWKQLFSFHMQTHKASFFLCRDTCSLGSRSLSSGTVPCPSMGRCEKQTHGNYLRSTETRSPQALFYPSNV